MLNWFQVLLSGGFLCLWWFTYSCLRRLQKGSFAISFILCCLPWALLLAQTIRRVLFVIHNGGMERADGYGSPLAFLLGVVAEQFFFLPLTVVVIMGIGVLLSMRRNAALPDGAVTGE